MKRVGFLGGGQLAQMLSLAAVSLGCETVFLEPDPQAPAQKVARGIFAPYTDSQGLQRLAEASDVITLEFENVPELALAQLSSQVPVYPNPQLFQLSRNRLREKDALQRAGLQVAPYVANPSLSQAAQALAQVGGRGILKTAELGYDGKGQIRVNSLPELEQAIAQMSGETVLESLAPFVRELSIQVARNPSGEIALSGVVENVHVGGILRRSIYPAQSAPKTTQEARELARNLAEQWQLVGLLTLELFELPDGQLWVNEMAPRVHNSGHLTQNGGNISQFEAQIRAVCDLPLHDFAPAITCGMVNILGWDGPEPDWQAILRIPGTHLHWYGKSNRLGRKLGHINVVGEDQLIERMQAVETLLYGSFA